MESKGRMDMVCVSVSVCLRIYSCADKQTLEDRIEVILNTDIMARHLK